MQATKRVNVSTSTSQVGVSCALASTLLQHVAPPIRLDLHRVLHCAVQLLLLNSPSHCFAWCCDRCLHCVVLPCGGLAHKAVGMHNNWKAARNKHHVCRQLINDTEPFQALCMA